MSTLVTRDPGTGLRRGPVRWPDGTPPPPYGCRRCGHSAAGHGWGSHAWERPTNAQILARMKAREKTRRAQRPGPCSEISLWPWANRPFSYATATDDLQKALAELDAEDRPERCEEMTHNSIGSETFCVSDDPDHDGLCDDGEDFTWLGVRNEERGQ
ncbi:hypothetical protein [Streptomyces anulatus]|uniref:hypothetical protein n=1 Tax=Streptomyces anulatus TaxID=1892 RepID=UPI0036C16A53